MQLRYRPGSMQPREFDPEHRREACYVDYAKINKTKNGYMENIQPFYL